MVSVGRKRAPVLLWPAACSLQLARGGWGEGGQMLQRRFKLPCTPSCPPTGTPSHPTGGGRGEQRGSDGVTLDSGLQTGRARTSVRQVRHTGTGFKETFPSVLRKCRASLKRMQFLTFYTRGASPCNPSRPTLPIETPPQNLACRGCRVPATEQDSCSWRCDPQGLSRSKMQIPRPRSRPTDSEPWGVRQDSAF